MASTAVFFSMCPTRHTGTPSMLSTPPRDGRSRGGFPLYSWRVPWFVYVLVSAADASTYVGVSVDVERRLRQHNGEKPGGARRTRAGRPWSIGVVYGPFESRSDAQRVEYRVKRLRGKKRLEWQ